MYELFIKLLLKLRIPESVVKIIAAIAWYPSYLLSMSFWGPTLMILAMLVILLVWVVGFLNSGYGFITAFTFVDQTPEWRFIRAITNGIVLIIFLSFLGGVFAWDDNRDKIQRIINNQKGEY